MNRGELLRAQRHALTLLDEWIEVTGFVVKHTGYHSEIEAIIETAVDIGARAACGVEYRHIELDSEDDHSK